MRRLVAISLVLIGSSLSCASALAFTGGGDLKELTDEQMTALEVRADHAQPKDQPLLFAQLIATMTLRVDEEMAKGDIEKASNHLNRVQEYTRRLHEAIGADARKLREAEIVVRETTQRMHGMVRQASIENREVLHAVESRLSDLQQEMMLKVFAR